MSKFIQLAKPRIYTLGHLLANFDYRKKYRVGKGWGTYVSAIDDSGKTVYLSKTMIREHFKEVEQ